MEARADVEESTDSALRPDDAGGRPRYPRKQFQKRCLAGSVAPDNTQDFSLLEVEVYVSQGPDSATTSTAGRATAETLSKRLPESSVSGDTHPGDVALGHVLQACDQLRHLR